MRLSGGRRAGGSRPHLSMAHLTRSPAGVAMLLAVACLGLHSPAGAFHGTLPVPSTFARRTAQLRPPARGRAASIRHGAVMTAVEPRVAAAAHDVTPTKKERVRFYDTTLRDGAQGEGISLSCDDKLRIAARSASLTHLAPPPSSHPAPGFPTIHPSTILTPGPCNEPLLPGAPHKRKILTTE